jgi:hypothetical protein
MARHALGRQGAEDPAAVAGHDPWRQIREHLIAHKERIFRDIQTYPSPIAGCDAQFNSLLEERDRVGEAVRLLEEMRARFAGPTESLAAARDFVNRCPFFDSDTRRRVLKRG